MAWTPVAGCGKQAARHAGVASAGSRREHEAAGDQALRRAI